MLNQHISKFTNLEKHLVNLLYCTTLQEQQLSLLKQTVCFGVLIEIPSIILSKTLQWGTDKCTKSFSRKYLFFQQWIHMKDLLLQMLFKSKLLSRENMSLIREMKVIIFSSSMKEQLKLIKTLRVKTQSSWITKKEIISVKEPYWRKNQELRLLWQRVKN